MAGQRRGNGEGTIPVMLSTAVVTGAGLDPADALTCVGLDGLEPSTSSLSGMRSNRLSYSPKREV
jgi:hypothetical protein